MSNAPKTGFWQTIPGLITATAGFLSAATGAIVALNQTGVVDLKKIAGNKPPEQVATEPAFSAGPGKDSPVEEKPSPAKAVVEASNPHETVAAKSEPAAMPPVMQAVETKSGGDLKPAGPVMPQEKVTSSVEAQPVSPRPVETTAIPQQPVRRLEEVPVQTAKVPEQAVEPQRMPPPGQPSNPAPSSRVVESRPVEPQPQSEPMKPAPKPTSAPPANTTTDARTPSSTNAPPAGPTNARTQPSPSVPPQPSMREPVPAPSRQPVSERVADARSTDRPPVTRPENEADTQPRIVRAPSDDSGKGRTRVLERPVPGGKEVVPGGTRETRPGVAERGRELDLTGLKMTIPSGWVRVESAPSAMATEATLRIADPMGDGTVQISRYMGSKGKEMEDKTIDRWLGLVVGVRGGPAGRGDAKIERRQQGPMRITTVEPAGTVKVSPRDTGAPNQRMMGIILDHPLGPHLITITGPADAFTRWSAAIDGFLNSARPE